MQKTVKAPSMPIASVRYCVRVTISAALFLCGCSSGLKFDTPVKPSEIWVEHKHRPLMAHAAWDVVHFGPAIYSKLNGNPPYYVKQADVWIFGTKEGSPSGQQYWVNVIPRGIPSLHYRIATTTSFGSSLGAKENEGSPPNFVGRQVFGSLACRSGQARIRHNSLRSAFGTYSVSSLPSAPARQSRSQEHFDAKCPALGLSSKAGLSQNCASGCLPTKFVEEPGFVDVWQSVRMKDWAALQQENRFSTEFHGLT